jgi:excisionase family DNA binding protein
LADYLKIPEVARRLDVSEPTVRRMVKGGKLPSVFVGGAYRVSETDLEKYLEDAKVVPGGGPGKAQSPLPEAEQRAVRQHEGLVGLHESAAQLGRNVAASFANFGKADLERLGIFHKIEASLAKMRGTRDIWGKDPEDLAEAIDQLEAAASLVTTALQEHHDTVPQEIRPALDELLDELLKDRASA